MEHQLTILILAAVTAAAMARSFQPVSTPNYCPYEHQLVFPANCGRGGTQGWCPPGSFCEIAPDDTYAVCCPYPCNNGMAPLSYPNGTVYACGRGQPQCPINYYCEIAPNDAWAVCCFDSIID